MQSAEVIITHDERWSQRIDEVSKAGHNSLQNWSHSSFVYTVPITNRVVGWLFYYVRFCMWEMLYSDCGPERLD